MPNKEQEAYLDLCFRHHLLLTLPQLALSANVPQYKGRTWDGVTPLPVNGMVRGILPDGIIFVIWGNPTGYAFFFPATSWKLMVLPGTPTR